MHLLCLFALGGQRFHDIRVVDIKFDDYIEEKYCSQRLQLDLLVFENCLKATEGVDKVYNVAANMGGIGFITSVFAPVATDWFPV